MTTFNCTLCNDVSEKQLPNGTCNDCYNWIFHMFDDDTFSCQAEKCEESPCWFAKSMAAGHLITFCENHRPIADGNTRWCKLPSYLSSAPINTSPRTACVCGSSQFTIEERVCHYADLRTNLPVITEPAWQREIAGLSCSCCGEVYQLFEFDLYPLTAATYDFRFTR